MKRRDKNLYYQTHARKRMGERGISPQQVERAVYNPDKEGPANRSGATRFEKKISPKRRVCVIADEDSRSIGVVTAFNIGKKRGRA